MMPIDYTTDKQLWLAWVKSINQPDFEHYNIPTIQYILDNCNFAGYMFGPIAQISENTISAKSRIVYDIEEVISEINDIVEPVYFYCARYYPGAPEYNSAYIITKPRWLVRYAELPNQ